MAWLHNLAGKAEDLLNKIDKNAANVLSETSTTQSKESVGLRQSLPTNQTSFHILSEVDHGGEVSSNLMHGSITEDISVKDDISTPNEMSSSEILINLSPNRNIDETETTFEKTPKTDTFSTKLSTSFHTQEELLENYEEKVLRLERENQDLTKQLLNLQHLFSELQNENSSLQNQIERANESVILAHDEMEQYKSRVQRILQEKEKVILLQNDNDLNENLNVEENHNEELTKELELQQQVNKELSQKLGILNNDLSVLQQQYVSAQNKYQATIQKLQEATVNERKDRLTAEEECRIKTKELQSALLELTQQQNNVKNKTLELDELKERLKERTNTKVSDDIESRLHSLTQILMKKQNTLETVTTERNALRIQLEKLENKYQRVTSQNADHVVISNVNDTDDVKSQVPRLMIMSPFDAGVTRRVKHAYSTLDAISIRTGVFLRRYPLARIFLFCYMVLLHMWMIMILYIYIPSSH